ncbi:hypothetical protein F5Y01DRAFT_115104 [Xylaria sp. FL0043]|nr:hypothetical protein F5Y01DRAFT_115104 [Xylaria sp. FL0043]
MSLEFPISRSERLEQLVRLSIEHILGQRAEDSEMRLRVVQQVHSLASWPLHRYSLSCWVVAACFYYRSEHSGSIRSLESASSSHGEHSSNKSWCRLVLLAARSPVLVPSRKRSDFSAWSFWTAVDGYQPLPFYNTLALFEGLRCYARRGP